MKSPPNESLHMFLQAPVVRPKSVTLIASLFPPCCAPDSSFTNRRNLFFWLSTPSLLAAWVRPAVAVRDLCLRSSPSACYAKFMGLKHEANLLMTYGKVPWLALAIVALVWAVQGCSRPERETSSDSVLDYSNRFTPLTMPSCGPNRDSYRIVS